MVRIQFYVVIKAFRRVSGNALEGVRSAGKVRQGGLGDGGLGGGSGRG